MLGISAQDERSLLVTENLISSNTTNGVRLNSSGCTLCGNLFLKNWVGLVGFDSTGVSITGNEFCASTQCGLYVTNLDDLKMTLNEFVDSGNIDMEIAGALRDALIVQNSFSGPSSVVIDVCEALDLSLNSWGAAVRGHMRAPPEAAGTGLTRSLRVVSCTSGCVRIEGSDALAYRAVRRGSTNVRIVST